ncbi:RNA polymerase sigma factor [Xinfangfangia sp. D13-10-4-6]|nr:RNA polymerase sigma factor [Pseudogemmobacter hezensis]
MDDSELLNRAIARHYHDMTQALTRRGHMAGSEADIVHDLYLKLAGRPGILRGKTSVGAFLCRAAINLGIDRFRRQNYEARLFSGTEAEGLNVATHSDTERLLDVEARLTVLKSAIEDLPGRCRMAFILHRLHGLTPDQITARLGISRNMVDRHLRKALAHCLDRLMEFDR